ncbi:MAG TPA: hypothetical protein PLD23_11700 [Armatimonadota bacterium]|nr:hypothetical protein [Armatimonadota bacterium]
MGGTTLVERDLTTKLCEMRATGEFVAALAEARARPRRARPSPDGRLALIAADHPARGVTEALGDSLRMADRHDYLSRIMRALEAPLIDGVMGTSDVLEDLLVADLLRSREARGALLRDRLLIGSMNRGGLSGTTFELDDRVTGYTPDGLQRSGLDGGKVMVRIDRTSRDSGATLEYAAAAVEACGRLGLVTFVEPLPVERLEGRLRVQRTVEALAWAAGIASGLGSTSVRTWLKLPWCEGFAAVARATTLPIVLLGGPAEGEPERTISELGEAMRCAPNVRGALCGRNVLYPGDSDPLEIAQRIAEVVHGTMNGAAPAPVVE